MDYIAIQYFAKMYMTRAVARVKDLVCLMRLTDPKIPKPNRNSGTCQISYL